MGIHFKPGNISFSEIKNPRYVDKSELIAVINDTIGTEKRLSCISRPRRFGKSYAATLLAAYYDKSCDSSELFSDLKIAKMKGYEEHRNKYQMMCLDMAAFLSECRDRTKLVPFICDTLRRELAECYPGIETEGRSLPDLLAKAVETDHDHARFFAIIDEWDAPIRDPNITSDTQHEYLEFLRSLFKNVWITNKVFAGAYLTGILPIKKDGSQSAISEFREYTIMNPGPFAPYAGFLDSEVRELCQTYNMDYEQMKHWYDGYHLRNDIAVYNPNSVMLSISEGSFESYWSRSSSSTALLSYINMNVDGIGQAINDIIVGIPVEIDPSDFDNDPKTVNSRNSILTLLVHYGYLSYDHEERTVSIPNHEVRLEFERDIKKSTHIETMTRVRESIKLLEDTALKDAKAVERQLQKIHREECSPLYYNNEQALRAVIKLAYFSYRDEYIKMEELPSGNGYADIVYLPKKRSVYPALVVELKAKGVPEGAIAQIKDRNYPDVIRDYGAPVLLVGITYDRDDPAKTHYCVIEEME